ncbi:unnamed protein product, partial [Linum tenue]
PSSAATPQNPPPLARHPPSPNPPSPTATKSHNPTRVHPGLVRKRPRVTRKRRSEEAAEQNWICIFLVLMSDSDEEQAAAGGRGQQARGRYRDASLITALVERWRPETSSFHMSVGEVTITLEDVATLSGLLIDGEAVIVDVPDRDYAWGAAVLAYLYREMGRSVLHMTQSSSTGGEIGGWVALLQLWAWERFPLIAPQHTVTDEPITADASPRGARWLPAMTRQHGDQLFSYKLFFDVLETIVWLPYWERDLQFRGFVPQSDTFRAVVPLICFSVVMWHHPDR